MFAQTPPIEKVIPLPGQKWFYTVHRGGKNTKPRARIIQILWYVKELVKKFISFFC